MQIKKKDYFLSFKINGFVTTGAKIKITPQVSGRISSVSDNTLAGDIFKKNQILFQIDPIDFELNIETIKSKLKQNEAQLKLKQAEYEIAISEWKKINKDKPIPDLVSKKPPLDAAKAALNASKAELNIAEIQLERTKFSFPFNGKIISSNVALGQFINAGKSLGEVFDIKSVEIDSSLNKEELKWLKLIDKPKILINTQNHKQYEGYIARISDILDPETRFTNIVFDIPDAVKENLKAGEFVEIEISDNKPIKIFEIPIEALQDNDNIWEIADMKLKNKKINILQIKKNHVIVLDDQKIINLANGNLLGASDGDLVKLINTKTAEKTK